MIGVIKAYLKVIKHSKPYLIVDISDFNDYFIGGLFF